MSARTEQLLTEINELEAKIAKAQGTPLAGAVPQLQEQLRQRRQELTAATQALNEGKQVLKG